MNYVKPLSMSEMVHEVFVFLVNSWYYDGMSELDKMREVTDFWIKSAEEDYKTAQALLTLERYVHALFFCHLTIEKSLKSIVVNNTKEQAPYEHNLYLLSCSTGITFSKEQLDLLDDINTFNIKGRYDDYKFKFYQKATKEYTEAYFKKVTDLYIWLKKQIIK